MKYRVEIFRDNCWQRLSSHIKIENALFNAYKFHKNKNKDIRVIHEGKIIAAYYKNKVY
jgi:hypothetical protein